jgi:hypothetical protein
VHSLRSETGQASSELVAVVPVLLLLTLAAAQLAIVGFGLWIAGDAARAGARAALFDGGAERVATDAVPRVFDPSAEVSGTRVRVEVRPPSLLPGIRMPEIATASSLDPAGGEG